MLKTKTTQNLEAIAIIQVSMEVLPIACPYENLGYLNKFFQFFTTDLTMVIILS